MKVGSLPEVGASPDAGSAGSAHAVHPGPKTQPSHPASSSISSDTATLSGSKRAKPALFGGASDTSSKVGESAAGVGKEKEEVAKALKARETEFNGLQKKANMSDDHFSEMKKLAGEVGSSAYSKGKTAGEGLERNSLMWKIPLTLLSGVALGLIPAWAIASKDDKTMKQLRDQLAAAQTQ